jgi:hypothetical protein
VTLALKCSIISAGVVWRHGTQLLQLHGLPFTGSRLDILWLSGRRKTPTLCVFPVLSASVMEKCCDACGNGEYYFGSSCLASEGADFSVASIAVERKSMGHTVAERSWKDADFVCISCIKCVGYGKML